MRRRIVITVGVVAGVAALTGLAWALHAPRGVRPHGGWWAGWRDPARSLTAQAARAGAKGDWAQTAALCQQVLRDYPGASMRDTALLLLGDALARQDRLAEARDAYKRLLEEAPNSPRIGEAQDRLGDVNIRLLFSSTITPPDAAYDVRPGDTLTKIAKEQRTTVELLMRANHLSSGLLQPKMRLKVPRAQFSVVVNKSQNTLLLKSGEDVVKVYRVATGKNNSTPVGTFTIITRIPNPPWYTPQGVIPFGDPRNILGTRWMGFDKPSYGIHGTADPSSIGKQATAGCVRMANHDVEELYTLLPLGTPVTIID